MIIPDKTQRFAADRAEAIQSLNDREQLAIEAETVLLPEYIAEDVLGEIHAWAAEPVSEKEYLILIEMLVLRANRCYTANAKFRRDMAKDTGRDQLKRSMRHWLGAFLGGAIGSKQIPHSFHIGHPI